MLIDSDTGSTFEVIVPVTKTVTERLRYVVRADSKSSAAALARAQARADRPGCFVQDETATLLPEPEPETDTPTAAPTAVHVYGTVL